MGQLGLKVVGRLPAQMAHLRAREVDQRCARDRLGEVIVRHMWPDVDVTADPEGHLMSRAAAMDIVGKDLDELDLSYRADVLREYPRLGLADEFLTCFQDQARRKPTSSAARAVRTGLADRIAANPLDTTK